MTDAKPLTQIEIADWAETAMLIRTRGTSHPWSNDNVERLLATIDHLASQVSAGGWNEDMSAAPRDGSRIIYLDHEPKSKDPWFSGDCVWRERDGEDPHWWDDACTREVLPVAWMHFPKVLT